MITFSQKTEKTENLSKSASYKIVKDEALSNIKRTVEVRLNETLNREDLAIIANEIKKTEKTSFQKTFISYCITKDQCSPYWATTNFNPNLEVLIIGFSADEEIKMKNLKENIEGELIAKWLDDKTKSLLIGYKNNSSFYMKTIYTDNTSSIEEYTWKEVNGSLTLKLKKDNEGEYFIITKDKQLEFWNKERKYDMLLPMK